MEKQKEEKPCKKKCDLVKADRLTETASHRSRQSFGQEISKHVHSFAVFNNNLHISNVFAENVVAHMDVLSSSIDGVVVQ